MATEILRPNGVGASTDIPVQYPNSTYHWDKVDEDSKDNDSTYVQSEVNGGGGNTGLGLKDYYTLQDTAIPANATINSVTVHAYCKDGGTDPANHGRYRPWLRLGANEQAGTYWTDVPNDAYGLCSRVITRPGGGSWAVSDLNDLQVGLELWDYYDAAYGDWCRCTQIWVEVDYTPVVGFSKGYIIG